MKQTQNNNVKKTVPTLRELNKQQSAGFCFSASALASMLFSFLFVGILSAVNYKGGTQPDWYLYCSFLLPQLAFVAVALLAFLKIKVPVREVVGKPSVKYFLLAVAMQFGLLSLSQLNGWFVGVLEGIGYVPAPVVIPSTQGFGLVGALFVVALLPAIMEEVIFRGFLMRGLRGFGSVASILLCGALFSLYHQNPVQTAYQFCCGVAFALIALRSGSVLPTVLAHFLNNAVIVLYYHITGSDSMPVPLWLTIVAGVCLAATFVYLLVFDKKPKNPSLIATEEPTKTDKKGFFFYAAVGLVVCFANWLGALV